MNNLIPIIILIILGQLRLAGQTLNTVDKVKLTIPCKLELVLNEDSQESYSCQTLTNDIPSSYSISINNFGSTFQKFDEKGKRIFMESFLNEIKSKAEIESENIKYKLFSNIIAIQYDDYLNIGGIVYQSRSLVFCYNYKSITLNYVSTTAGYDSRFEKLIDSIVLF